jgi:hypothetical protein
MRQRCHIISSIDLETQDLKMTEPTLMTSREFNSDTAGAKRATANGPVFITDRGQPSHVLLSYPAYVELTFEKGTLFEAFSGHDAEDADLEIAIPHIECRAL